MRSQRQGAGALVCACAAALLAAVTPAHAAFPGANGRIAVTNSPGGNFEISQNVNEYEPAFSPDGTKIAWWTLPGVVYVMNADGTAPTALTNPAVFAAQPDWAAVISRGAAGTPSLCPKGTSPSVRCVVDDRGRLAMIGTDLDETFFGTSGVDRISPFGGNDVVNARAGADKVSGGQGRDRLNGGKGNDRLNGNSGGDRLRGGPGRDSISGGSGNDRISGGRGRDRISCGPGRDRAPRVRSDRYARGCERR